MLSSTIRVRSRTTTRRRTADFLAEQEAAFVAGQAVGFLDDLDGGAFAEVGFAEVGDAGAGGVEDGVGVGGGDLDADAVPLDPFDDVLGAEAGGVEGGLVQTASGMMMLVRACSRQSSASAAASVISGPVSTMKSLDEDLNCEGRHGGTASGGPG